MSCSWSQCSPAFGGSVKGLLRPGHFISCIRVCVFLKRVLTLLRPPAGSALALAALLALLLHADATFVLSFCSPVHCINLSDMPFCAHLCQHSPDLALQHCLLLHPAPLHLPQQWASWEEQGEGAGPDVPWLTAWLVVEPHQQLLLQAAKD